MRTFALFLLCFIGLSNAGHAQESDSLKMATAFNKALASPNQRDIFLKEALTVKRHGKSTRTNEIYAYLNARYLFLTGQLDASENVVVDYLNHHPNMKGKGRFYNILGTISTMRQDYKKAISWYEKAIQNYTIIGEAKGAALVKSNIANIFFSLSDFESAYNYIDQAHTELKPFKDSTNMPSILGVLSISEAKTGRYKLAAKHANETLEIALRYNNKNGIPLAYLALAEIAVSEERYNDAVQLYQHTDSVATSTNNLNLMHLAHVGLLNNYVRLNDFLNAKNLGEKALAELASVPNKTTEYSIRKNLSEAYAGLREFQKAYVLRKQADSIYAETSSIKNKEYINELLIRYDTQRKESQLKIERNENLIKQAQLTQQGWILFALSLLLLMAILVFIGYRNVQRNKLIQLRIDQENELMRALIDGEEKERERIANELHDGLASDLTGIKMILSQTEEKLPEGILNTLERVHEQTRRISHNLSPLNLEQLGLVRALNNFAQENSTIATPIQFYSSKENIDIQPIEHAILIYRITQEFIQNALKHATAKTIDVQLLVHENELTIHVEDNGCGFDVASKENSFGLMNAKKHIDLLKGELTIDSRLEKGTVVFLSLPLP